MLSRVAFNTGRMNAARMGAARSMSSHMSAPQFARSFSTTVRDAATIEDALKYSGYSDIDFTIKEDAPVYDAVQKFAAYNIGCLVVTDEAGTSSRVTDYATLT